MAEGQTHYTLELLRDGALLAVALALVRLAPGHLALDRMIATSPRLEQDLV